MNEILLDEIECPLCGYDYCNSCDVEVNVASVKRTHVTCDECGGEFVVISKIEIEVEEAR